MARLVEKGFSVLEPSNIEAVRTGSMKAQYPLAGNLNSVENGTLLVVDDVAKTVALPALGTDYVYLHWSEEMLYDPALGRNNFRLEKPSLPRMLRLTEGDIFETNAVELGAVKDVAAWKLVTTVYGIPSASGDIALVEQATLTGNETVVLEVVEWVRLPNRQQGIKFVVIEA